MKHALILALAALLAFPASAVSGQSGPALIPTVSESVARFEGEIRPGDLARFRVVVSSTNSEIVALDSAGGDIGEAFAIAAEIQRRDLSTFIDDRSRCTSACAILFFAGRHRLVATGAVIGIHPAHDDGVIDLEVTVLMARVFKGMGVPASIVELMVLTPVAELLWITPDQYRALRIEVVQSP